MMLLLKGGSDRRWNRRWDEFNFAKRHRHGPRRDLSEKAQIERNDMFIAYMRRHAARKKIKERTACH